MELLHFGEYSEFPVLGSIYVNSFYFRLAGMWHEALTGFFQCATRPTLFGRRYLEKKTKDRPTINHRRT